MALHREQDATEKQTEKSAEELEKIKQALAQRMAEQAAQSMNQTKHKVSQMDIRGAKEKMEEAERYLEQAKERLDEEAERYAQLAQEQLIFLIKTELQSVLEAQEAINTLTAEAAATVESGKPLSRRAKRKLSAAGRDQAELAAKVRGLVERLGSEAEVFGFVLVQVAEDQDLVADRLRERPPVVDPFTRMLQDELTDRVRHLLESFKLELKRRQDQGQQKPPGGGGGGGRPPLVPPLAEVQMLRSMQTALRARTVRIRTALGDREDLSEAERTLLGRLSHTQGNLADVLQRFLDRVSGGQGGH
ncbi:MAG: hypothetical protein ACYTGX_17165 [Planctomycetota bacterium]|jgi:hypothetical protein